MTSLPRVDLEMDFSRIRIAPDRSRPPPTRWGQSSKGRTRQNASCFDPSLMPTEAIRKRELYPFSVHYSIATSKWIATLARPALESSDDKRRCIGFPFTTEREARKFAKAYSPPKMIVSAADCVCCSTPFDDQNFRPFNCRNCGSRVCDNCSTRWGIRMVPKTFLQHSNSATTVRACKSCDWLSNAFCLALLRGNYDDALRCHSTGNVNLRCTFADISREAM
jgi:FYVE zinc finger